MHKVGDMVFKSDGKQFNRGQIVRIIGNKSMVNFNGSIVTVQTAPALPANESVSGDDHVISAPLLVCVTFPAIEPRNALLLFPAPLLRWTQVPPALQSEVAMAKQN